MHEPCAGMVCKQQVEGLKSSSSTCQLLAPVVKKLWRSWGFQHPDQKPESSPAAALAASYLTASHSSHAVMLELCRSCSMWPCLLQFPC